MAQNKNLNFGTIIYATDDILESDLSEDSYNDEVLIPNGEAGKFIAYSKDGYGTDIAIVFFEPDIILRVSLGTISMNAREPDAKYKCYVCGTYNNLEKALDGCSGCGVPYNPIDDSIGSPDTPDVTEENPF